MSSRDPATAAFSRYSRRELDALSGPIEVGCGRIAGCDGSNAPQIIRSTFRDIAGYFVRMAGAMNEPTNAFWRDVAEFFESQAGGSPVPVEEDTRFFVQLLEPSQGDELPGGGEIKLKVLDAIRFYDNENNTAYLPSAKMFIWRFAEAFVAADLKGTVDEEAALEQFRKVLDATAS